MKLHKTLSFAGLQSSTQLQQINVSAVSGEIFEVRYLQYYDDTGRITSQTIDIDLQTYFYNGSSAFTIAYNQTVDFGQFFAGYYTQKEFLLNVVKMFNLYIEQTDTKTLRVETRDDFYNGENQDWSKKLDYGQPHQLLPKGDLQNNPYKFT